MSIRYTIPLPEPADDPVATHCAPLIAQALATNWEQQDLRVVGLVIDPDAPEAEAFRRLLSPELRAAGQGLVGTMPPDVAVRLLGEIAPGTLDWLEDDGAGALWRRWVIHVARRGGRTTSIEYEAPD